MGQTGAKPGRDAYMDRMTKLTAFALLLASTLAASAQSGLMLPPSPAEQNAQVQADQNTRNLQTQLNTLQVQQSNMENHLRQQQLFNSMPGYRNRFVPVTPTPRP